MTAPTRAERRAAQEVRYWPTAKAYAALDQQPTQPCKQCHTPLYGCDSCDQLCCPTCDPVGPSSSAGGMEAWGHHGGCPCPDPTCDGETHWTGQRDPHTNADLQAGPCPLWTAR